MKDDITKPTFIYGASDDLIEFEGGMNGEHGAYMPSDETACAVFLSDGTVLSWVYADDGIWKVTVRERGSLLKAIVPCTDADAHPHSDVVEMNPGVRWAYACRYDGEMKRVE